MSEVIMLPPHQYLSSCLSDVSAMNALRKYLGTWKDISEARTCRHRTDFRNFKEESYDQQTARVSGAYPIGGSIRAADFVHVGFKSHHQLPTNTFHVEGRGTTALPPIPRCPPIGYSDVLPTQFDLSHKGLPDGIPTGRYWPSSAFAVVWCLDPIILDGESTPVNPSV